MEGENNHQKRSRQGRRSDVQLAHMVDYFIAHPHVASGRLIGSHTRESLQGNWEELVTQLNDMRNKGTKPKDLKSWKECWRDMKSKTSKKAVTIRELKASTDNEELAVPSLTDLEIKILKIIGWEFAEGLIDCPDSFPEEQPDAIRRLSEGDETPLRVPPQPLTGRPDVMENVVGIQHDGKLFVPSEDSGGLPGPSMVIQECVPPKASCSRPPTTKRKRIINDEESCGPSEEREPIPGPSMAIRNGRLQKVSCSAAHTMKRKRNERLSSWLKTAKDNFSNLAEKNAERMERLMESIEKQSACTTSLIVSMEKQSALTSSLIQSMEKQNALTASAIQEMAATNSTLAALLVEKTNLHS